jgi:hypothetical protein
MKSLEDISIDNIIQNRIPSSQEVRPLIDRPDNITLKTCTVKERIFRIKRQHTK